MAQSTDVGSYVDGAPAAVQPAMRELRKLIFEAAPSATDRISYGMPAYDQGGLHLLHFSAAKRHLCIYGRHPTAHRRWASSTGGCARSGWRRGCRRCGSEGPPWPPFAVRRVSGTAGCPAFRPPPSSTRPRAVCAKLADEEGRPLPTDRDSAPSSGRHGLFRRPCYPERCRHGVAVRRPAERAEELAVGGTPKKVADQLAHYLDAGAVQFCLVSNVLPWAESWPMLAEVRQILLGG